MKKVVAWVVFAAVVYAGVMAAQAFSNPWAVTAAPSVLDMLPPSSAGCGEGCK